MIRAASGKMGIWRRWKARKNTDREFLTSHVLARHAAWFPVYNHGREAPAEAMVEWRRRLLPLSNKELILLIAENRARNRLLGKTWPIENCGHDESKEIS